MMPLYDHEIRCYAQRLLNPFRGVMNVIRYQSAQAVTTDGVTWEIYVSRMQTSDIRYGRWTAEDGLCRGPIFPSEDFRRLEEMGATVFEALCQRHDSVPFAFTDVYELWLLDADEQPLALIHSMTDPAEIELDIPLQWRAGNHCQKSFKPLLDDVYIAEAMTAAEMLMLHINAAAGYPLKARWYLRDSQGNARGIAGINVDSDADTEVERSAFSPYFVNADKTNDAFVKLLEAFVDWQAPWFLLLPTLSMAERIHFEQQARQHALMVDAQYRLYPEIIDPDQIKGARVEAMLRKNQPDKEQPETMLSTWHLELDENELAK